MMEKFLFVIVSKDENFKISNADIADFYAQSNEYAKNAIIEKVANNSQQLTTVYNKYLNLCRNDDAYNKYDFIVFLHADVSLDIQSLIRHIEQCSDKYDAMGLCGCSRISVSQSPFNWFCGSRPYPESRWGCVKHGELSNSMSYFSRHSPDITDHSVACIDGLCIIVGRKIISSDLLFDEIFTFDFYDSDFSFQCVLKYKFRLGVLVEKDLMHYSVGKSILSDDFLKHEIDFRRKWKLEIPKDSKLFKLISTDPQLLA